MILDFYIVLICSWYLVLELVAFGQFDRLSGPFGGGEIRRLEETSPAAIRVSVSRYPGHN